MATFTTGSTATSTTRATQSQREDLANFISNIVRDDIPFMSSIGKGKASAILHEWSTDTLERPGPNSSSEGAGFTDTGPASDIKRLGNVSQIFSKTVVVSGSIEAVNKAGRKSEFKYQSEKRGKELMRDMEWVLTASRQVKSSGSSTRLLGGYQSWAPLANTINSGTGTAADAAGNGSDIVSGVTNVDNTFTLSDVDNVMQAVWQNGGKPTTLMMSPAKKRAFSTQAQGQTGGNDGVNNVRRNIDDSGKLTQSVTLYESDFGLVKVIPNYIMAAEDIGSGATTESGHKDQDILVYDSSSFKMATLRPLHHRDISEDGDRLRALMVHEATLECMNPAAVGLITGLGNA